MDIIINSLSFISD